MEEEKEKEEEEYNPMYRAKLIQLLSQHTTDQKGSAYKKGLKLPSLSYDCKKTHIGPLHTEKQVKWFYSMYLKWYSQRPPSVCARKSSFRKSVK